MVPVLASRLVVFLSVICLACTSEVTITTQLGNITGLSRVELSSNVYIFSGIAYATPPIGNLRFRQSVLNTSRWNGVYNATAARPACVQTATKNGPTDEDCLFLNVFTTQHIVDNADQKLVPVMVHNSTT